MKKKRKKKCWCRNSNGLLPNCITKGKDFILQYNQCIAKWKGLSRLGIVLQESVLQHKDIEFSCIVIKWNGWAGSALQYTGLYCRLRLGWERKTVLQYSLSYCKREVSLVGIVSQYNILYCDSRGSGLLDCVATQGRDTANQATTRR